MKSALLALTLLGCGCGRYADFSLPPLAGGNPALTFAFEAHPNPVLGADAGDTLNPSVVPGLVNVYSVFDGHTWRTALARSQDGIHWRPEGIVLAPDPNSWEGSYIAANGSALLIGNEIWYWYEAGARGAFEIGLARGFRKHPRPVLSHGPYRSWDERVAADPDVLHIGSFFYMYYLGQDRADPPRQRLGLARSADGVNWEKLRSNPVLTPGEPGSFDENGIGEPAVWQSNGFYWMLYTGRDAREYRRLGLARSADGVRWTKMPAVFSGSEEWDSKVICDPTVLVDGSGIRVWFGGGDVASLDQNLHGRIGYAILRPAGGTLAK
jgi:hypothetical protein